MFFSLYFFWWHFVHFCGFTLTGSDFGYDFGWVPRFFFSFDYFVGRFLSVDLFYRSLAFGMNGTTNQMNHQTQMCVSNEKGFQFFNFSLFVISVILFFSFLLAFYRSILSKSICVVWCGMVWCGVVFRCYSRFKILLFDWNKTVFLLKELKWKWNWYR